MIRPGMSSVDAACLDIGYSLAKDLVRSGTIPSAVLAVAAAQHVIRCEGYGLGDVRAEDAIYLCASLSKPIVATAVMQLVEDGRLSVGDRVVRHLPEFAVNSKDGVTVGHLLTHTSGLSDDYWQVSDEEPTPEMELAGARNTTLRFHPGSRFEYCTVSFRILGEIVRRLSGLPLEAYLEQRIFVPARMAETGF
jgi:CubicO group peptidase (beta-lactamase class C family)